jgi:trimeric autotransporter adhesin
MTNIRNVVIGAVASAIGVGILVSCGGGGGYGGGTSAPPAAAATVVRSASLDQAQETPAPPVASTATGRGAVVVNPNTLDITGGITFTGLTGNPNAAHIHTGAPGVSGPPNVVTLTLAADNATATIPPGTKLTPTQYTDLLAGNLYFNVHTTANPNGEIRGQISGTTGVTAGLATLNAAQEAATYTSTATGVGTIVFDSATPHDILICYVTHDVTNANPAHIHTGAPGVSGPANVVTLTSGPNIYYAPVPAALSAQAASDMTAGNTYFNIHSTNNSCPPNPDCTGGEIRGQIVIQ